jgi:hypothetical protein
MNTNRREWEGLREGEGRWRRRALGFARKDASNLPPPCAPWCWDAQGRPQPTPTLRSWALSLGFARKDASNPPRPFGFGDGAESRRVGAGAGRCSAWIGE